ncbi:MAG: hypothetical protein E7241_00030 [Lachnospiraceae bacterium]|nr:hypothetical protein [Lachnospiraceae bacterium]
MRQLTVDMVKAKDDINDSFRNTYCKEDIERMIKSLRIATRESKGDKKKALKKTISRCFMNNGVINVDFNGDADYYGDLLKLHPFPTKEELLQSVHTHLLGLVSSYKDPAAFLERVVDEAIPKTWKNDSLRLKILKSFICYADCLKDFGFNYQEIKRCVHLYLKEKKKISKALKDISFEDMRESISCINDDIFASLTTATKQQKGKEGTYGLLKIADDLSIGRFSNSETIREYIYIFALVFNMTFLPVNSISDSGKKAYNDIEAVMFRDYYTNNLIRFITDGHSHINSGGEIINPMGRGINPKNYMELIYLYHLKPEYGNYREKISGIFDMAQSVYEGYSNSSSKEMSEAINNTMYYLESLRDRLDSSRQEFIKYLIENYDCNHSPFLQLRGERILNRSVLSYMGEQNTGYDIYLELKKELEKKGIKVSEGYDGLTIDTTIRKALVDYITVEEKRLVEEHYFSTLGDETKLDIVLNELDKDLSKGLNVERIEKNKTVCRTDILKMYYWRYLNEREENRVNRAEGFGKLYQDFCQGANGYLRAALFQEIDGRNLYDMIMIFSLYVSQ